MWFRDHFKATTCICQSENGDERKLQQIWFLARMPQMSLIQRKRLEIERVGVGVLFAVRYQHRCTNEYLCSQPRSTKKKSNDVSFFSRCRVVWLTIGPNLCPASLNMLSVMSGTTLPLPYYDSSMPWTCLQKPLQLISVTWQYTLCHTLISAGS